MPFIDFHTHKPTAEGVITPRSFGIHPWHSDSVECSDYDTFFNTFRNYFCDVNIIGECGLDKVCGSNWERQTELFEWQIRIAENMNKPMVIHCVHAFNELMSIRHKHRNTATKWVVHGFTGTLQLAEQLYKNGIMVSFGAALLNPERTKVRQCLLGIRHPWFLETDDSDCGIETIYCTAAAILNTNIERLSETISQWYKTIIV